MFVVAARNGMRFGCHYHTNLNILSHCICVHQERYLPQRDSNPLPPGSELPTLPMSLYILHFAKKKFHIENLFGQVLYNLH